MVFPIKLPHKPKISRRKPIPTGELQLQIFSEGLYHPFTPPADLALLVDGFPDIPIQLDQFGVDRAEGPVLGLPDASLDFDQKAPVTGGDKITHGNPFKT